MIFEERKEWKGWFTKYKRIFKDTQDKRWMMQVEG